MASTTSGTSGTGRTSDTVLTRKQPPPANLGDGFGPHIGGKTGLPAQRTGPNEHRGRRPWAGFTAGIP